MTKQKTIRVRNGKSCCDNDGTHGHARLGVSINWRVSNEYRFLREFDGNLITNASHATSLGKLHNQGGGVGIFKITANQHYSRLK